MIRKGHKRVSAVFNNMGETGVYLNGDGNEPEDHRKLKIKEKKATIV